MDKEVIRETKDLDSRERTNKKPWPISLLRFFAWLNLVCGAIAAVILWRSMGTEKALRHGEIVHIAFDPVGIGLGITALLYGILGFAVLLVVCLIAENLIEIRKNTGND